MALNELWQLFAQLVFLCPDCRTTGGVYECDACGGFTLNKETTYMHDKNKKPLRIGDKVRRDFDGVEFHVHGAVLDDGRIVGGNVKGAHHSALASQLELVKVHNEHAPEFGDGCIVWGDGPPDPDPPS